MPSLGVNIDHVATVRQARGGVEPDPIAAAAIAEFAGAEGITIHLREDRRHIVDRDLRLLRETVKTKLNLEMAATDEMVGIATAVGPCCCTLVPEKRQELTTEGGLDVIGNAAVVAGATKRLKEKGIIVSLFVDPVASQIEAAAAAGADYIEIHTGSYAEARTSAELERELAKIRDAVNIARDAGLKVNAGHGLNYTNVAAVAAIPGIEEFNIGHSIISRAIFVGLDLAVRDMVRLIKNR